MSKTKDPTEKDSPPKTLLFVEEAVGVPSECYAIPKIRGSRTPVIGGPKFVEQFQLKKP